jgi:nucleotide-binding universal stress UspA family protein
MLKRILVPLDPYPFSKSAVSHACELAADHGAEVTGLIIIDKPGIHESVSPVSPGSAHIAHKAELRMEAEAHERLLDVLKDFGKRCDEVGVEHRSIERSGEPASVIEEISGYYDLLVIGLRTHFHFQTSEDPGETLSELIGHLSSPILAVPETYSPFGTTLETVIAFDGSPASIRSMRQFAMSFAEKDLDIVLLTATDEIEEAKKIAEPAKEYLAAYGFDDVRLEWEPGDIIDIVDERYIDSAEVIVSGMHSKKGFFEFHVGSLPDHLVSEAKIPVYIGQ